MSATSIPMKPLLIVLLSTGWLLPLYLSVSSYLSWANAEAWPLLTGGHPHNSFPYLAFSQQALAIGFCWLAVAIGFWSVFGFQRLRAR